MKSTKSLLLGVAAALLSITALSAQAQVRITEVTPWGSGTTTPYSADWFELTNFGSSAVNIAGWKIDDNSNSFASAVALMGISSIAAGESVIFIEGGSNAAFLSTWFGGSVPAALQAGTYSGSGVGLGAGGDAVNIYNASGVLQANVTFGASEVNSPFHTFDNAAALNNTAISTLSNVGTNGAFVAANDAGEIGSPGTITAVPEPGTYALMLAGLGMCAVIARKRLGR